MGGARRYFGTDGVRGKVGTPPLTADFALRLANAAGRALLPKGGRVLIGKDTRLSGYLFESALEAGFVSAGVDTALIGPLPTPGVAYLTKKLGYDLGVVISASHNPYDDNGIKFFTNNGGKLSDREEEKIEALVDEEPVTRDSMHLGRAARADAEREAYEAFCIESARGVSLKGLKVVVDTGNGAAYKVAPNVLSALGVDVIPLGVTPNGKNINDGCGAVSPALMQNTVRESGADAGIALDGDADRVIMADKDGNTVNGDSILYILARAKRSVGGLRGPVVGTVLSNMGLEVALKRENISFMRAQVGDRHIIEMLKKNGGNLGGEPSGHILDLDTTTTGDGTVVAVAVLSEMVQKKKKLAELVAGLTLFPQYAVSVPVKTGKAVADIPGLMDAVGRAGKEVEGKGHIVVRPSGTEPVMRVMVEHENVVVAKKYADELASFIRSATTS